MPKFERSDLALTAWITRLSPGQRARLLAFDCNVGFTAAQTKFLNAGLDEDATAPLIATSTALPRGIEIYTLQELDSQLEQAQAKWLRTAKEPISAVPSAFMIENGSANDATLSLFSVRNALLPVLPWHRKLENIVTVSGLRACLSTSMRSIDVIDADSNTLFNVKISLSNRTLEKSAISSALQDIKLWTIEKCFGVDRFFDGGLIRWIDAAHSLSMSKHVENFIRAKQPKLGLMRETLTATDASGHWRIFRDSLGWPYRKNKHVLIPLFSLVYAKGRKMEIFSHLVRQLECAPEGAALSIGGSYLICWWQIMTVARIIFTMPHAQNGLIEVNEDGTLGRIIIKDMRDLDLWERYISHSAHSTRLQAVDAAYLRYEMKVHPLYYDYKKRSTFEEQLASDIFNYSFQMLHNHVLRGLEQSVGIFSPAAARTTRAGFSALVSALADGAVDTTGHPITLTGVTMLEASRRLRDRYVSLMTEN